MGIETENCQPLYESEYIPEWVQSPEQLPHTEWDCWVAAFDNRRSRAVAGQAFFRSVDQVITANCISVEILQNVPRGWLVWNDDVQRTLSRYNEEIVYRPIDFRRTVVRKYDITNSNWYTAITDDTHIIIPDPLSPTYDLIDSFVIEGNHTGKFNTSSIVCFCVLQSEENTGIYFIDRERNSVYDQQSNVTRIYTENRLPVTQVNKRYGRTSLLFKPNNYNITSITYKTFEGIGTRRCFEFEGNVIDVFSASNGYSVGFFATINDDSNYLTGNYIVDKVMFDPVQNRTYVSVKDYKGTARDVENGVFTDGNVTNLHAIETYETNDTLYIPSELPVRTLHYTGSPATLHEGYMNVNTTPINFLEYYNGSDPCSLISLYSGDPEFSGSPLPLPPYILSGPTMTYCDSREYTQYSNYLRFSIHHIDYSGSPIGSPLDYIGSPFGSPPEAVIIENMLTEVGEDITIGIMDSYNQLRTLVNGISLLVEAPHIKPNTATHEYFDTKRYFVDYTIQEVLYECNETFLTGGNGFPSGFVNITNIVQNIRSGPHRTMAKLRTGENQNGSTLSLNTHPQEWNGSDWQDYVPNADCRPQII